MKNRPVYVVGGSRTPFVKSMTNYINIKTQDLMTASLSNLVFKYNLNGEVLGDVALGAVINSSANWGLAREATLSSGLSPYTPAVFIQRACGTGLEAAWHISNKIQNGQIEAGIAGGVDTNSDLPVMAARSLSRKLVGLNAARSTAERAKILLSLRPSDLKPQVPAVKEPRTGLSMGQHTELMVKEWKITREEQDLIAFHSHRSGARAYEEGFFKDLVFEFNGLNRDTLLRADTTLEKLAKLKPAFDFSGGGTLTAGNSSPLTDGSSVVLLASEGELQKRNWKPLARIVDFETAAVDYVGGDGLLMAPTIAVGRMLDRNSLALQDFDYYEIHEAFAGQVLCNLKAWNDDAYCKKFLGKDKALGTIDLSRMNVKGGSIALGHPFSATGGRIVASLAKMLSQHSGKGRGLISICTAGGMGVTAILETV